MIILGVVVLILGIIIIKISSSNNKNNLSGGTDNNNNGKSYSIADKDGYMYLIDNSLNFKEIYKLEGDYANYTVRDGRLFITYIPTSNLGEPEYVEVVDLSDGSKETFTWEEIEEGSLDLDYDLYYYLLVELGFYYLDSETGEEKEDISNNTKDRYWYHVDGDKLIKENLDDNSKETIHKYKDVGYVRRCFVAQDRVYHFGDKKVYCYDINTGKESVACEIGMLDDIHIAPGSAVYNNSLIFNNEENVYLVDGTDKKTIYELDGAPASDERFIKDVSLINKDIIQITVTDINEGGRKALFYDLNKNKIVKEDEGQFEHICILDDDFDNDDLKIDNEPGVVKDEFNTESESYSIGEKQKYLYLIDDSLNSKEIYHLPDDYSNFIVKDGRLFIIYSPSFVTEKSKYVEVIDLSDNHKETYTLEEIEEGSLNLDYDLYCYYSTRYGFEYIDSETGERTLDRSDRIKDGYQYYEEFKELIRENMDDNSREVIHTYEDENFNENFVIAQDKVYHFGDNKLYCYYIETGEDEEVYDIGELSDIDLSLDTTVYKDSLLYNDKSNVYLVNGTDKRSVYEMENASEEEANEVLDVSLVCKDIIQIKVNDYEKGLPIVYYYDLEKEKVIDKDIYEYNHVCFVDSDIDASSIKIEE